MEFPPRSVAAYDPTSASSEITFLNTEIGYRPPPRQYSPHEIREFKRQLSQLEHGQAWRAQQALKLIELNAQPRSFDHDPYIRLFHRVLRFENDAAQLQAAVNETPAIRYAWMAREQFVGESCHIMKARILAGEDDGAVAANLRIEPRVVEYFAKIFFDVRHRLHAYDWIHCSILNPARQAALKGDVTAKRGYAYQHIAYQGGPLALDHLLKALSVGNSESVADVEISTEDTLRANAFVALLSCEFSQNDTVRLLKLAQSLTADATSKGTDADRKRSGKTLVRELQRHGVIPREETAQPAKPR